jgi:lysophospholipase L1-like esterase
MAASDDRRIDFFNRIVEADPSKNTYDTLMGDVESIYYRMRREGLITDNSRSGRSFLGLNLQPATDRCNMMATLPLSNGTDTGSNSETYWPISRNIQSLALSFSNFSDWGGVANANNITVRAAVLLYGAWTPILFQGKRDVVIEPDGIVVSDVIGAQLAAGTELRVRTYVTVSSGGKWATNTLTDNAKGEGVLNSATPSDLTTNDGAIAAGRTYGYAPFTVLGNPGSTRTLVLVGDSILQQQHDTINTDWSPTSTLQWGFARRFAYTNKIPLLNLSVIGDTVTGFVSTSGRKYAWRRGAVSDAATVLTNFGRNDIDAGRTLAQMKADLITLWEKIRSTGAIVYQTTITPKTTSTDSWATVANQTVAETESIRVQLNDWIRTVPTPLSGIFDVADMVETSRNSGIWKANLTDDGIHPVAAGHIEMAKALTVTGLKRN